MFRLANRDPNTWLDQVCRSLHPVRTLRDDDNDLGIRYVGVVLKPLFDIIEVVPVAGHVDIRKTKSRALAIDRFHPASENSAAVVDGVDADALTLGKLVDHLSDRTTINRPAVKSDLGIVDPDVSIDWPHAVFLENRQAAITRRYIAGKLQRCSRLLRRCQHADADQVRVAVQLIDRNANQLLTVLRHGHRRVPDDARICRADDHVVRNIVDRRLEDADICHMLFEFCPQIAVVNLVRLQPLANSSPNGCLFRASQRNSDVLFQQITDRLNLLRVVFCNSDDGSHVRNGEPLVREAFFVSLVCVKVVSSQIKVRRAELIDLNLVEQRVRPTILQLDVNAVLFFVFGGNFLDRYANPGRTVQNQRLTFRSLPRPTTRKQERRNADNSDTARQQRPQRVDSARSV